MAVFYQLLLKLLSTQRGLYEEYLGWAEKERRALVSNKMIDLNAAIKAKEKIMAEVNRVEEERLLLLEEMESKTGLKKPMLTLQKISELCEDQELSQKFLTLKDILNGLLKQIRKINATNQLLITHSMDYIQRTFDWISDKMKEKSATYAHLSLEGAAPMSQTRNLLNKVC